MCIFVFHCETTNFSAIFERWNDTLFSTKKQNRKGLNNLFAPDSRRFHKHLESNKWKYGLFIYLKRNSRGELFSTFKVAFIRVFSELQKK